jgi:hypothetical protein
MPRAMTKETYAEHWSGGHATSSGRSVHVPDDVERVSESMRLLSMREGARAVSASDGGVMLPARAPKKQRRATRWKSQAHRRFVTKDFACANCGALEIVREPAHVRIGSGAGMGEKPDDWRCVPLCGGSAGCHATQHRVGERTFWSDYEKRHGSDRRAAYPVIHQGFAAPARDRTRTAGARAVTHKAILTTRFSRERFKRIVDQAPDGYVAEVRELTRSDVQNRKLHAMIEDLRQQIPGGEQFSKEDWKLRLMHALRNETRFLQELEGAGQFPVGQKTSELSKSQFSTLIEIIYAYGAKHDVAWSERSQRFFAAHGHGRRAA